MQALKALENRWGQSGDTIFEGGTKGDGGRNTGTSSKINAFLPLLS
jgi:hypothetical protein